MLDFQDLVFAILVAKNQLVTLVRPKKYSLHPSGEELWIFMFILDMTSFKLCNDSSALI